MLAGKLVELFFFGVAPFLVGVAALPDAAWTRQVECSEECTEHEIRASSLSGPEDVRSAEDRPAAD